MSKPVLGYWDIRGFAEQIRLLLRYLEVDFEDKQYPFGPAPDFHRDSWLSEKFSLGLDFPNLPYWIEGDFKVSESKAILKYVAAKYGKNMVPEDAKEVAVAEMVMGHLNDVQRALVNLAYGRTGPIDGPLEDALAKPLELLVNFLGSKKWVLGDNLTYVDFFMYEVLKQLVKYKAGFLSAQPGLEGYLKRFEELPQLKDYIVSIDKLVCYSPYATLQF